MIGDRAAIGLAAAVLLSRSISAFLFGVQPLDPLTFVTVAAVLAVTARLPRPCARAARGARRPGCGVQNGVNAVPGS